jgi:hypothetical protein
MWNPNALNNQSGLTMVAHEMGHAYGLDHSYSTLPDRVYGDAWDVMSAMTFGNQAPYFAGPFGASGPGLNTPNLYTLDWIPSPRIWTYGVGPTASYPYRETVTLAAVNHPEAKGYLMVRILQYQHDPIGWHMFTVEFRKKDAWDRSLQRDAVLTHEVRPDGHPYILPYSGTAQDWQPGQTYINKVLNLRIDVLGINDAAATATVNIGKEEIDTSGGGGGDVGNGWTWGNAYPGHGPKIVPRT